MMIATVPPIVASLRADPGLAAAWRVYKAAVQRKATPSELLPLAQAVYDALPRKPADDISRRIKAVAAFNLGKLTYQIGHVRHAIKLFKESDRLFVQALGGNALERVDPLWELGKLVSWSGSLERMPIGLRHFKKIEDILDKWKLEDPVLRAELALREAEIHRTLRHPREAAEALRRFFGFLSRAKRGDRQAFARLLVTAGDLMERAGLIGQAVNIYCQAIDYADDIHPRLGLYELSRRLHRLAEEEESGTATSYAECLLRLASTEDDEEGSCDLDLVSRPRPEYPQMALDRGLQGLVVVEMVPGQDGRPRDVWIRESLPVGYFEAEALRTARRFHFKVPKGVDISRCGFEDEPYSFVFFFRLSGQKSLSYLPRE